MIDYDSSELLPHLIIPVPNLRSLREIASDVGESSGQAPTAVRLARELACASVVAADVVPENVVTMHTRSGYRDDVPDQARRMTLVYLGEEHWDDQYI